MRATALAVLLECQRLGLAGGRYVIEVGPLQ